MAKNKVIISGVRTSELKALKNDEMTHLFIKLKDGDKTARDKLSNGNLKLVLSILKKYHNKVENLDDLFQIGVVGLLKAIDNFDLSFNVNFSTYAVFMIEGEIKRYIRDNTELRISRGIKECAYEIINFREKYYNENYSYPSSKVVCDSLNISEYEYASALDSLCDTISIFKPIYDDGGDTIYLLDQLESKKSSCSLEELISLRDALTKLKEKEKIIIVNRYYNGLSQSDIAKLLEISQAQVSRLESSAIKTLKKMIS